MYRVSLIGEGLNDIVRNNGIQSGNTTELNRSPCPNSSSVVITAENTGFDAKTGREITGVLITGSEKAIGRE
jgi:hypothetical protein